MINEYKEGRGRKVRTHSRVEVTKLKSGNKSSKPVTAYIIIVVIPTGFEPVTY